MSMTLKEMACTAQVSRDTVERTVRRLFPEIMGQGKATHLNEHQAVGVMADLRKQGFVELPQSAEVASAKYGSPAKLPAGIQLRELRLMAERGIVQPADVRRLLGLDTPATRAPLALPPALSDHARRVGYAAAENEARREAARSAAEQIQGKLGL